MLEKSFEKKFAKWCTGQGWVCLKLMADARGFPDRTVITGDGDVFFLEFKTAKGKLSVHQEFWIQKLLGLGCKVAVVRSFEEAVAACNAASRLS